MRKWIDLFELAAPTSAAFRQWFAGSKVVDRAGNPLVCYHGSRRVFSDIQARNARHHLGHKLIFTSDSPDAASEFAGVRPDYEHGEQQDHEWTGGKIHPVYVRMVKPFVYWNLQPYDEIEADFKNADPESRAAYAFFGAKYYNIREYGEWNDIETNESLAWLKSQGYDGFTAHEAGGVTYACFDDSQVRSVFDFRV